MGDPIFASTTTAAPSTSGAPTTSTSVPPPTPTPTPTLAPAPLDRYLNYVSARALGSEIARAAGDLEWEAWFADETHSPMWHRFRTLLAELVRRAAALAQER
jgi:hypothetical protein